MPSSTPSTTSTRAKSAQPKATQAKSAQPKSTQAKATTTGERKVSETAVGYVQQTGQRAVDVPVGAVLTARDRVNGAVEPWTNTETRSKELSGLRNQVSAELKKFERRGGQARRKAADRVRATGSRVSRRARRVESTVKEGPSRIGGGLKRARSTVQGRTSSSTASS